MYIGRFAPSPTGPLHMGSLVAAVGSYLRARSVSGVWLLRIEDLDPPREVPGAADQIRRSLHAHGLFEDRTVLYQSDRPEAYDAALQQLADQRLVYPCSCSRKHIEKTAVQGVYGLIYPGTCLKTPASHESACAWRVKTDNAPLTTVTDLRCGSSRSMLSAELGDFVVKRADGFFAYQLAVVVDDAAQGVTEVVRGEDLLDNTLRQRYLQKLLRLPTPDYLHLPLVYGVDGQKLSKQTFAPALENHSASNNMAAALSHLGLSFPDDLQGAAVSEQLNWAQRSFSPALLPAFKSDHLGQNHIKGEFGEI